MPITRSIRAGAVVIDGDRVLMMSQIDRSVEVHRWYHFPGGRVEHGETPEEAVVREVFEELGLHVRSIQPFLRVLTAGGEGIYYLAQCEDLVIGECTGPERDFLESVGFRAEWVPIAELAETAVWPRAVAEHVAALHRGERDIVEPAPVVEDLRISWEGTRFRGPSVRHSVRLVLVDGPRIAVMRRWRAEAGPYATLPGGGVEDGESPPDAAVREAREELGLDVEVGARLAVVQVAATIQTYVWTTSTGGQFGAGDGEEFTTIRQAERGTYEPAWVRLDELAAIDIRPTWLIDELPRWIANPSPTWPDRFIEEPD